MNEIMEVLHLILIWTGAIVASRKLHIEHRANRNIAESRVLRTGDHNRASNGEKE